MGRSEQKKMKIDGNRWKEIEIESNGWK